MNHGLLEQNSYLNKKQKDCINALEGNVLVLSGAGTGKTTVITNRFLKCMENGVESSEILCVTFTNKAANEISKRISAIIGPVSHCWIGTFHGICFRLLQQFGQLSSQISIIDEYDQHQIAAKLDISDFLKNIQLYKENLLENITNEFKKAYNSYQEFLTQNKLIDFGEIILATIRMLEENPHIQEILRNKFKYIMIDEYQDTSMLYSLMKLFSLFSLMYPLGYFIIRGLIPILMTQLCDVSSISAIAYLSALFNFASPYNYFAEFKSLLGSLAATNIRSLSIER